MSKLQETQIVTPPARLSFPYLFEMGLKQRGLPDLPENKEYSATILIAPGTDLQPFANAVKAAMLAKWKKVIEPKYPTIESAAGKTTKDGKPYAGHDEGWHVIRAKNRRAPIVVDQQVKPILAVPAGTDEETKAGLIDNAKAIVYPGCWCRFLITAYAWDNSFGRGVSWSLEQVQLVKDDTPFVATQVPSSVAFTPIEGTSTDAPAEPDGGGDDELKRLMG